MNNWLTPGNLQTDNHIKDSFIVEDNNLTIEEFSCNIELEAKDKPDKKLLSKKFVDLLGQGYKPGEAAKRVGTSIKGIMSDSKVSKQIKALVENYQLNADVRRQVARNIANKIALENMDGDPTQQKLALDAIKVIGADTEVGINAPPQPGIQINVGNLSGLFANIEVPEDLKEQENIIDVSRSEPLLQSFLNSGGETILEGNQTQILDAEGIERLANESK